MTEQDFKGCVHLARHAITQAETASRLGELYEADMYVQGAVAHLQAGRAQLVKQRLEYSPDDKIVAFPRAANDANGKGS
ncbi:MAG: hypothetical protein PVH68_14685 [Armatimonadota bacterium]|jgi:hypothetical protein